MDREIPLYEKRKALRKQIFKYGAITVSVILALYLLLGFLRSSVNYKDLTVSKVDKGSIEFSINASGKIIPLNEEVIVSPINSRILEVYKNPGEKVAQGEAILKLELASVETEYNQKLDEREIQKRKLEQSEINSTGKISDLKTQEKIKEMQLKQMLTELKNEQYLDSIGASTSDKVRQAEYSYQVTQLELAQLKEQITNESKNLEAELKVQQLDLSISDKALAESQRLLQDSRIHAPMDATLTFVNNQIGSQVAAGSQIAIVSDLSHFKVEAEIADSYAEKLSSGAKAIVKVGAMQMEGTVVNVIPSVKNGVINFTVLLKDSGNSRLRSGLKTDVYVIHSIGDDVLRIPNASYYIGAGEYELWVVKNDEAEKRKVKLGESSFEYVEVISGLNLGEQVITSDMSQYKDKEKIKISK